jgi:hypothetical protein
MMAISIFLKRERERETEKKEFVLTLLSPPSTA